MFLAGGGVLVLSVSDALGGDGSTAFSLVGALIQMIGALGIVIGIILLVYAIVRKGVRVVSPLPGGRRYIRVIETRYLAPRQALVLVEVGGRYLLIALSPGGLSFLREIDMLEEIEVIDDGAGAANRLGNLPFKEIFSRLTKRGGI